MSALGALRESLCQVVQPLPHMEHRELHVGTPVELEADQGLALARPGVDRANGRNAADHGFHGLRDEPFDLRRTGVDYYSLPNLVQTMRSNRYSLIDEIMQVPLLTLAEVLKKRVA